MKSIVFGLAMSLTLLACHTVGYGFQGRAGEKDKIEKSKENVPKPQPKGKGKAASPNVIYKTVPSGTSAPVLADLTVHTGLSDCTIIIDGERRGVTNNSGMIRLPSLRPGSHIVKVSKNGYRDAEQRVELFAGRSDSLSLSLNRILSVPELITTSEEAYRNARYDDVLAYCREALASQPDNPRANMLFGQASYMTGQADSATPLWKALSLGEAVTLPIKHHHGNVGGLLTGKLDDLCSGNLILRKGSIEFQSKEKSDENFSVRIDKIIEVKNEIRKGGRLSLKVKIPKGNKETDKTYNFHALAALVFRPNVVCAEPSCGVTVDTLYTLLQKLKQ